MTNRGDTRREWPAILLLLGFAVAFVGLVPALAVALCRPERPVEPNGPGGLSLPGYSIQPRRNHL